MSKKLRILIKASLLILLVICFHSCETIKVPYRVFVAKYPIPEQKATVKVVFVPIAQDASVEELNALRGEGFFLSFAEYQNLAVNVEQYRQHIKRLEQVIEYYENLACKPEKN